MILSRLPFLDLFFGDMKARVRRGRARVDASLQQGFPHIAQFHAMFEGSAQVQAKDPHFTNDMAKLP